MRSFTITNTSFCTRLHKGCRRCIGFLVRCRSLSAKEPLIVGFVCRKQSTKIRQSRLCLHHPVHLNLFQSVTWLQASAINIHIFFACETCPIYGWLTYQNSCTSLEGICHDVYMYVYVYIYVNICIYVFFLFFSLYVCRWIYIDLPLLHLHVYAFINWFSFNECVLDIYPSYNVPAFVHVFTPYPPAWFLYMNLYAHIYAYVYIHIYSHKIMYSYRYMSCVFLCMCVGAWTCACVCVFECVCARICIFIDIDMYTWTCTYICILFLYIDAIHMHFFSYVYTYQYICTKKKKPFVCSFPHAV